MSEAIFRDDRVLIGEAELEPQASLELTDFEPDIDEARETEETEETSSDEVEATVAFLLDADDLTNLVIRSATQARQMAAALQAIHNMHTDTGVQSRAKSRYRKELPQEVKEIFSSVNSAITHFVWRGAEPDSVNPTARSAASELRLLMSGAMLEREVDARANCKGVDPTIFYPERGGSSRMAKGICAGCVVKEPCLEAALMHRERFGVWGGLSERERRRVIRARNASADD